MWEVYTKNNCPFCDKAKFLLRDETEITLMNISEDPAYFQGLMVRNPQARTLPQIYKDGKLIGGYTELQTFIDLHSASGGISL
jgi:glutaredoxin